MKDERFSSCGADKNGTCDSMTRRGKGSKHSDGRSVARFSNPSSSGWREGRYIRFQKNPDLPKNNVNLE